ncbi:Uncharacterized protein APZ42_021498 [Daphnia magna]|uniref:Uncharacterized protein n=1 Tax=Daphnia magna TaxID=35525 RepID=A0A164WLX0_9CRUS|nr:Uncharacterized protein APZ42_021498 [Daphnia magna]
MVNATFKCILIILLYGGNAADVFKENAGYHVVEICSDFSRWNIAIPPTAHWISDLCDAIVKVERQGHIFSETTVDINFIFNVFLSTVSDEISDADARMLSTDKAAPGLITLFDSNSSHARADQLIAINGKQMVFDIRNIHLALPTESCGQMFLIVALWNSSDDVEKTLMSTIAWPFQVTCETTDADLALYVELEPFPPAHGIFVHNMTIVIGIPMSQQLMGTNPFAYCWFRKRPKSVLQGSSFLRRTSVSVPKVMAYLTQKAHSLLAKSLVRYDTLEYRLGDEILHGDQLIDLLLDQSSPEIKQGQKIHLNTSQLQLFTTSICGEAWMVFRLDLEDVNVENNFAVIPVIIDCSVLSESLNTNMETCGVVPNEFSMGRSALMFTSMQFGSAMSLNAFLYKTEEKTYLPLRGNENFVPEILDAFRMIQLERNRLSKLNQCPFHPELRLNFNTTLFGHLYHLILLLNESWIPSNQTEEQRAQQEKILLISQALGGLLFASTSYNSVPAYFMDSVLNGLFSYWPFFPFDLSSIQSASPPAQDINPSLQSWHERFAKVVTHFMRTTVYADYEGKPNPDTGLQNFLNQLLWSPDALQSATLSKNSVDKLRQFLLLVLQKNLPRTFDDLPSAISNALTSFSEEVRSLIPVEEAQVWIGINTVYHAVQQSIKLLSLTHDEWKSDVAPNQGDISDKLAVLGSMISAVNTSVVVTRLTLLIRKIQESVSLNKQWILMEGMSDTALDAELYCRTLALNRIRFRENPEAGNLFNELDRITFWKRDSGVIYRGDISGITGRLYWNRIAVCHCNSFSKYQTREAMP